MYSIKITIIFKLKIMKTIKEEAIAKTLEAIWNQPKYVLPLYETKDSWYTNTSYEGNISNQVLSDNGYVYKKYRDINFSIMERDKQLHGNRGVFVFEK